MNEVNETPKQPVEFNPETNTAAEAEVVRKLVAPDLTEVSDPDDPRRPSKVDRTELKVESSSVAEETEVVRKLVTPDLTKEDDPDDPRRPSKVDRTELKVENVADSDEG